MVKFPKRVLKRAIILPKGGVMIPVEDDRPAIIAPIDLGQDGLIFAQSTLLDQKQPLSSIVAQLFNGMGTVFAPLEKGESLVHAKQFKTGRWMPTVAIRQWLADYIAKQWGQDAQLIIEDPWMKPNDVTSRPPAFPYFFSDTAVYYAPDNGNIYDALMATQRQSNFLFFGFVISPIISLPSPGTNVDQGYIDLLAKNTQLLFIRAYDSEGYVVWQR